MTITHHIKIDMVKRLVPPRVYAMQHDTNTRVMEMDLTSNGESWVPPEDVSFALSYQKPDGKRGFYNQLTEGVSAVTVNGSKVSVVLAPQVMTTPGTVFAALVMNDVNMDRLASFPVEICVIADPSAGTTQSDDYFNCSGWSASVHYTPQDLTPSEQAQARENIGAADSAFVGDSAAALDAIIEMQEALLNASGTKPDDYGTPYAVEYIKQELTEVAKAQARENIGAMATAGGTMAGAIDMGGNRISNIANPAQNEDAVNLAMLNSIGLPSRGVVTETTQNEATEQGIYIVDGWGNYCLMFVFVPSWGKVQVLLPYHMSDFAVRMYWGGGWQEWKTYHSSN